MRINVIHYRIKVLAIMIGITSSFPIQAQWTTGSGIVYTGSSVGIGTSAPSYPLQINTVNSTAIKLVNSSGGTGTILGIDFCTYPPATANFRVSNISAIDDGVFGGSLTFNTRTGGTTGSNTLAERLRISSGGNVGIGAFTNAAPPSKMLHVKGAGATLLLDNNSSPANYGIQFGTSSSSMFEIMRYPTSAPSYYKIGLTGTNKSILLREGEDKIIFSSTFNFGWNNPSASGLSGSFLFDGQASATSLLVSPPSLPSAPSYTYPAIPSGYIFNVAGNSVLNGLVQINNSNDIDPLNTIAGLSSGNNTNTTVGTNTAVPFSWIQTEEAKPLALNPVPNANPASANTSYVAIGFVPGSLNVPLNYKLAVKGKIICEELKVKYSGTWSDYVFQKEYKLRDLKEVETYIFENKHLPDVPSESEVKQNGFEAGEMDATLLRKIEELTLYMIESNKKMETMNERILLLENENALLKKK